VARLANIIAGPNHPVTVAAVTRAHAALDDAGVPGVRTCRVCGCTDDDCSGCIQRTGMACHWIEADLCSACRSKGRP
jgi:hypothetical protein